jgi:hypothetical protein
MNMLLCGVRMIEGVTSVPNSVGVLYSTMATKSIREIKGVAETLVVWF